MRTRLRAIGALGPAAAVFLIAAVAAVAAVGVHGVSSGRPGAAGAPPAPEIKQRPSDPTTSTRAHFTYTDRAKRVRFRCKLDGLPSTRCGAAKNYTRLAVYTQNAPRHHTFCVRAINRAGQRSRPTCVKWTIVFAPVASMPFQVSGAPLSGALLYPGGSDVPVNLVVTNPNHVAIAVTAVTTAVNRTGSSGCSAGDFLVPAQLSATPVIPAGSTRSLEELGIPQSQWPKLRMIDQGNQDACRGAQLTLAFDGTARAA